MIIVFASSKGGVGKSTVCAAVASELALRGNRVIVLDLDQNRTVYRWSLKVNTPEKTSIPGLTVEPLPPNDLSARLRDIAAEPDVDHILIDLAGAREVSLLKAIARADLVIIPAQASEPDIREAVVISRDVRDVEETASRKIPYRLLLTKMYPLKTHVSEFAFEELRKLGMPTFRSVIVERTAYREMFLNGEPPTKRERTKGAGLEIAALLDEIQQIQTADNHAPEKAA